MSSIDDLVGVTRQTQDIFSVHEDADRLQGVLEVLVEADKARAAELDKQRDVLRALTRQFETQKAAAQRPLTAPTEKAHREAITRLDDEKLQLGKKVAQLESEVASRETKLASTRAAAAEAERTEVEEDAAVDADVFKLAIIRSLGFLPVCDDSGQYSDILVRHPSKPDVHVIACPEAARSDFDSTNALWDLLA